MIYNRGLIEKSCWGSNPVFPRMSLRHPPGRLILILFQSPLFNFKGQDVKILQGKKHLSKLNISNLSLLQQRISGIYTLCPKLLVTLNGFDLKFDSIFRIFPNISKFGQFNFNPVSIFGQIVTLFQNLTSFKKKSPKVSGTGNKFLPP